MLDMTQAVIVSYSAIYRILLVEPATRAQELGIWTLEYFPFMYSNSMK